MNFDNPMTIECPDCSKSSSMGLGEVVGLEASCPECGRSFRDFGLSLRRRANEHSRYFIVWEVVWMAEARYGIAGDEVEVRGIESPRDLVELLRHKSGGRATTAEVLEDLALRIKRPLDESHLDVPIVDLIPDPVTGAT